jgi:crotonobetainyl-CoA:carnitine CoA-transferase CaiB-like acyl-CoA transferase
MTTPRPLRVLDLTDHAAAYATRLLVDLGVQVIRLEVPGRTHETRSDARDRCFNTGKRSAGIDLRREDGLEVLAQLCATADAVVEGIEPLFAHTDQAYARCGVANPRLTWVAIRPLVPETVTGGPKSAEILAMRGRLMSITGVPGGPALVGGGLADAVIMTLGRWPYARVPDGRAHRSTRITVSAHEVLSMLMQQGLYEAARQYHQTRREPARAHRRRRRCRRDGCRQRAPHVAGACREGDDRATRRWATSGFASSGRPNLEILEAWARGFSKADRHGAGAGHPVAPVCDILLHDPQLRPGLLQQVDGDESGVAHPVV